LYLRYHEAEKIFRLYPSLNGVLESLEISLESANKMDELDEDIYGLCLGGRPENPTIPTAGNISDKTGNIAANYHKRSNINRIELRKDILNISSIIQKLRIARTNFTKLQKKIMEAYYWEEMTWIEVIGEIESIKRISIRYAKEERKKAINKLVRLSKVTVEEYNWAMALLEGNETIAEQEG